MEPQVSKVVTQDGSHTLMSQHFGVSYHSKYGAIQESQHVFIEAGLHLKAPVQANLCILEMGFGTGLNALLTALFAKQHNLQVTYYGIEAFPISHEQAQQLNYPQLLDAELEAEEVYQRLHESPWNELVSITEHFQLKKLQGRLEDATFTEAFDLVYYDAFAPSAQPELWNEASLCKVADAMAPKGVFVTYCAKGTVKRTLKACGLTVEGIPGPPGKREMTRAIKA